MAFHLDDYLQRLGLPCPKPTAEGLACLQQAQQQAIAFENIDPFLGRLPSLETDTLSNKLLKQSRGGYCLELNGLLELALQTLGLAIQPIMARVHRGRNGCGPRSHLAFLVKIGAETWLADVGFGGAAPGKPLRVDCIEVQPQGQQYFRIRHEAARDEKVVETWQQDNWLPLYRFDLASVAYCDREAANWLCATWNNTPFPQHLLLFRNTPQGRIHLFDTLFTEFAADGQASTSKTLDSSDELAALVQHRFGLAVTDRDMADIAVRLGLRESRAGQ